MQGKNRFMPVHKPHPMNSVVRDDYYDSDNPRIVSWPGELVRNTSGRSTLLGQDWMFLQRGCKEMKKGII